MRADWKATTLGLVATLQRGFDLPYRLRKQGTFPIVTSSGIDDSHSEAKVKGPGVVTGRYGTIGAVFFVRGDFWPLNTTLYVRDFHGNDPLFVSYLLRTIDFRTHSAKSGVPGVNRNDLHEIPVALPCTKGEQEAIAEALSDADALIGSLEELLLKKRLVKQGAMQELLTGRKRLPGFTGEWELRKIGQFTDCVAGGTPSTGVPQYWGGSIRWMNSGELNLKMVAEVEGRITDEGLRQSSTKMLPANCVLVGLAGQGRTRGTVAMNLVPLCTNQSIAAIFPNEQFAPRYLFYNLDSRYGELRELSSGEGGRGGLNLTLIRHLELPLPSVEEQTAIAAVLSDMDSEIDALETKVAKTRLLKQAMMQELLTGRTRLV